MNKLYSHLILGVALATCVSLLSTGCTSTWYHSPPQSINLSDVVRVGDQVCCTLLDGTKRTFTVIAVEPATLVGDAMRVPVADITSISLARFDGKKTAKSAGSVFSYLCEGIWWMSLF